ncbi:MAG: MFS transporter [Chloroflexi bacterium]|nr:MAG: MFS transporter [Chloroflexota bacterium]
MNPQERRLIGYAALAHGSAHIIEFTYPALLTRIEDDFGLRAVITGVLATVFGWAFGSSAIPSGFLTDRLGTRRVLIYAFGGSAVLAVLVGLAPNEWFLAAGLLGLGLFAGLYHPAGLSLMAQGVRQRGLALGWHGLAGNTGQAMAPGIAIGLAILFSWRAGFFFVGGLAALVALVMASIRLNVREGSEVMEQHPVERPAAGQARTRNEYLLPLLIVYGGFILGGTVYRGAITYLPKHLEDFVNKDFGGAFVTVALLMGAVGQLIGGTLSQRWRLERMAPVIGLLTIPALVLTAVAGGPLLVVLASAFIFLYFANQPVFTGLIADYSPPGAVGRSYGISFFAGFGIGSMGGVIAGALVDQWDTRAAFLGLTGFLVVSVLLSVLLWLITERRGRAGPALEAMAESVP